MKLIKAGMSGLDIDQGRSEQAIEIGDCSRLLFLFFIFFSSL